LHTDNNLQSLNELKISNEIFNNNNFEKRKPLNKRNIKKSKEKDIKNLPNKIVEINSLCDKIDNIEENLNNFFNKENSDLLLLKNEEIEGIKILEK
jgi:hypothetical protein